MQLINQSNLNSAEMVITPALIVLLPVLIYAFIYTFFKIVEQLRIRFDKTVGERKYAGFNDFLIVGVVLYIAIFFFIMETSLMRELDITKTIESMSQLYVGLYSSSLTILCSIFIHSMLYNLMKKHRDGYTPKQVAVAGFLKKCSGHIKGTLTVFSAAVLVVSIDMLYNILYTIVIVKLGQPEIIPPPQSKMDIYSLAPLLLCMLTLALCSILYLASDDDYDWCYDDYIKRYAIVFRINESAIQIITAGVKYLLILVVLFTLALFIGLFLKVSETVPVLAIP